MEKPIYLDYNATTPVDREVAEAMLPFLTEVFGNASSTHYYGFKAKAAIEDARDQVAALLGCNPSEIIFTSGGTESNNMALLGMANSMREKGNHIIISSVEHPAVTEVAGYLSKNGFRISLADVDQYGIVSAEAIRKLIRPDTILISVMHANNEVGSIQPIAEISAIAHGYNITVHTDAAQSIGKIKADVNELGVDLLSIAGHKLYAPKGIGALYIKRGLAIPKMMYGANHEFDLRAGTENVPYIVALGKACDLIRSNLNSYALNMLTTRNTIAEGLKQSIPDIRINGDPGRCLPNTLSVSFKNVGSSEIVSKLKGVAVSMGAACHSGSAHAGTLGAMNLPYEYSHGALRISTGRYTTVNEAKKAAELIIAAYHEATGIAVEQDKSTGEVFSLTSFDTGMGCGCKLKPAELEEVLKDLPRIVSPNVVVGTDSRDDAAVYKLSDHESLVETVDFFTPMVDDPFTFGEIAAANALSDIYAMGAKPVFALDIVAFPAGKLPLSVLKEIIRGANHILSEAEIPLLGGHSIHDNGIKFGMVVTGLCKTKDVITNSGSLPGDVIVLTKPVGSGILCKAFKMGVATADDFEPAIQVMRQLNKKAAEIMAAFNVSACTDLTGFGLTGHLHEMAVASHTDAVVWYDRIPLMANTEKFARLNAIPGSTKSNEEYSFEWTDYTSLNVYQRAIVNDAQTSGGLLISIPENKADSMVSEMKASGIDAVIIGSFQKGNGKLTFTFTTGK